MEYIEIRNIKKDFNGKVVLDVDKLNIKRGEIVAIIGKNGSGKSTLLKIISGLLYQSSGVCKIDGLDNRDKGIKGISKFVLESGKGYYDYLTAKENISYFLSLNKINLDSKNLEKLNSYIKYFDFEKNIDKKVRDLSQGNRQKLSLIITLMTNPKIICLDEPTNGLDISSVNLFMAFLYNLSKNENKTILFTSHDFLFLKSLNARIILMDNGKIRLDRSSRDIFKDDYLEKTIIEIDIRYFDSLKELKNTKYEFLDNKAILSVYDKNEVKYILSKFDVLSVEKKPLTTDDIFYKVIAND